MEHLGCCAEVMVQGIVAVLNELPCSQVSICQQAQVLVACVPGEHQPADGHGIDCTHNDVEDPCPPLSEVASWSAIPATQLDSSLQVKGKVIQKVSSFPASVERVRQNLA